MVMDTLYFNDIAELAEAIICDNEGLAESGETASVYCKYDIAKELIKELLYCDYDIKAIEIEPEYGYEYAIKIVDNEIVCEQVYIDGKCFWDGSVVCYLAGDVNSKFVKRLELDDVECYEFVIGEESECDCCKCDHDDVHSVVSLVKDESDDLHGFTASKYWDDTYMSHSFYTSDPIAKDMILDMLEEFGY